MNADYFPELIRKAPKNQARQYLYRMARQRRTAELKQETGWKPKRNKGLIGMVVDFIFGDGR